MPQDIRMYPLGAGTPKSRSINNTFVEFGEARMQRTRVTLAQMNAGFTLLPALPGVRWRIMDASIIAIGGNAAVGTSVNIIGTRAGSAVQLLVAAIAALTRSAIARMGATNMVVLADGASNTQLDANTAITVITVGSAMTTATSFDVLLNYVADPA
jgi:hypothetical protein